jgi:hypothetical protein
LQQRTGLLGDELVTATLSTTPNNGAPGFLQMQTPTLTGISLRLQSRTPSQKGVFKQPQGSHVVTVTPRRVQTLG